MNTERSPLIFLSEFQSKILKLTERKEMPSRKIIIIDDGSDGSDDALFFLRLNYALSSEYNKLYHSYNIVTEKSEIIKESKHSSYIHRYAKNNPKTSIGINQTINSNSAYHQMISLGQPILTHIYYDNSSPEILAGISKERLLITVNDAEKLDDIAIKVLTGNITESDNWLLLRYKHESFIPDCVLRYSMILKNDFINIKGI